MMLWTPTRIALAVMSLLAVLLAAALWVQSARHANAKGDIDRAEAEAAAADAARDAAVTSADNWQRLAADLNNRLTACNAERIADRARSAAAVAAAQAAEREADATLNAWLDRYRAATASAECAQIERLPICEVAP